MRINNVLYFLLLLLSNNCKDRYQFSIIRTKNRLVVNGGISDMEGPSYLKLGTTSQIEKDSDPLPGAHVEIIDENGTREAYVDMGDGKYRLDGNVVKGFRNGTYILEIKLPDGQRYRSSPEKMPSPRGTDSAYFKVTKDKVITSEGYLVDNTNIAVLLNTRLPKTEAPAYFRWGIDEVYCIIPTCRPGSIVCPPFCYIYQAVSKFNLRTIPSSASHELVFKGILLQTRAVDFTFLVRHYFNITQYSMNPNAYDYWKKVELLTERNGSIFDTPPTNIPGNIYNVMDQSEQVFGYFEASAGVRTRVFVDRGYIPIDITSCDWSYLIPGGNLYSYCLNCNAIKGSTNIPPVWFF